MSIFDVRIPGLKLTVVAADGQDVEPVSVDEFRIAAAETYDVIVDNVGNAPFSRTKGSLNKGGRLLLVVGTLSEMLTAPLVSLGSGKRVIVVPARANAGDLRFLASLAESGRFKPVIDRRYRFEQMVEAHRYVDTGRKRGNVVVTL